MVKKSTSINLLKNEKNQTINQILNWALGIGRVLIIIVELVALAAFLYRFVLDNQIQDIQTKIKQEQIIVTSQKKNEDTYRNLQERLSVISSFASQSTNTVRILKDIIGFAPLGMNFTNVSLSDTGLRLEANVSSVYPLAVFINSLKKYPLIETISINKIENKTASAYISVSISITFKGNGGINASTSN
ncbi:MAG TPA: hypothetical protein VES68_00325 [Candidatus Sulfotelmatobacter sp.]|nr:hypothetical protein [Candidatus Sulfotelmatobacter sp.]